MSVHDAQGIRGAIIEALPDDTSLHGAPPEAGHLYVPPAHTKALKLESSLVIGGRGVGKTFWSAALGDEALRTLLGQAVPDLSHVGVRLGFGEKPNNSAYPDKDSFASLLSAGYTPYEVWRSVLARGLQVWLADSQTSVPEDSWQSTIQWVKQSPEVLARMLEHANSRFESQNHHALLVFDALDRSHDHWQKMDEIVRDLLRVILSLKPFPHIHGKAFLREDQYERRVVTNFPDASKLTANRVELTWAAHDLHGLLWQYLCNGPQKLRDLYAQIVGEDPVARSSGVWTIGEGVKRPEGKQRSLFEAIAGEWMGRDKRRGVPYVWSVGHLADGRGRTSPRSFLASIRAAAEDSRQRYPEYHLALHYESIKRGVQKASEIRVGELSEDDPWGEAAMAPLQGINVPCDFATIVERWQAEFDTNMPAASFERLPPEYRDRGWPGLRQALETLGIFERMRDDRVNMPDLYRVGFGLGRKGGVKPIAKSGRS